MTNEIKTAIPLLDAIDIQGKNITADAQRVLATNRSLLCIEKSCHCIIDWNYDEDCGQALFIPFLSLPLRVFYYIDT